MRSHEIGVVALVLGGVFLLYRALVSAAGALIWFGHLAQIHASVEPVDVIANIGTSIVLGSVGGLLVLRRHSLALRLFQKPLAASEPAPADPLVAMFTAVGLLLFAYGLVFVAETFTEWIASNITPRPDSHPADVWPYRVSSIVQFLIGYILLFHSPVVASWVLSRQHRPRGARPAR